MPNVQTFQVAAYGAGFSLRAWTNPAYSRFPEATKNKNNYLGNATTPEDA